MSCPKCNAVLPDASAFCNKCGASLAPSAAAAPALPLQASHPPPLQEPEQDLWKGRFSGKAQGHWWFLWFVSMPALVYLWFRIPPDLQKKPYALWAFVAAAVLPVVCILWSWMVRKLTTKYRLTNYRLFRETGLLSREINEVELVRVDDVSVRQNILQRIFNVGVITVIAPHDQTEPRMELLGIENPIEVKELIRNNVRRRRQGSLNVENL
jgi:membrane protein YdbS with pleckstrin-like domain